MERKIINLSSKMDLDDGASLSYRTPRGIVHVFERTRTDNIWRLLTSKGNLIVYQGREWLLERALNRSRIVGDTSHLNFISWFGLGTGGATITDPFNPLDPDLNDSELANPIVINAANTNYADGGKKMPFDNVEFLQDSDHDDRWLIARISVTLPFDEANGSLLNEAGLYVSDSDSPSSATVFKLFARYTFSTVEKTSERELLFRWELYF